MTIKAAGAFPGQVATGWPSGNASNRSSQRHFGTAGVRITRAIALVPAVVGLAFAGTPAMAEYSLKPAPESVNRMYEPGTNSGVQNADPWGYAAMAVGPDGRSWVIAARSENEARTTAQRECDAFGANCDVVVSGPDYGYFVGGYCQDGPRAAYSAIDFADAQDKFYGYVVRSNDGIVMSDQNCTIHWLGHRVSPSAAFRQARR